MRQHPRDGERGTRCIAHEERVEHDALLEPPLVLRRVHAQAIAVAEHQDARARQRERGPDQVEVLACACRGGRGIRSPHHRALPRADRAHRPPSPDAAMLFRIRRCPITNTMSIGIVEIADAAITSP
ncbi:hypothetical protein GCM10025870_17970 [Agromyces marinus]|uniref:Uncharacterized protein n=1 Tax=Agromyces marinus TaxID=1389020 RepID=A0ABN6YBJ7_9MICO|nr:hypothetical protein GCM10025870_17970 [Agromyces marinus]